MSRAGTILAVDDNEDALFALTRMLQHHGFTVHSATRGAEALEVARRENPDLILLDVMMPGMDGYEVTKRLKGDEALRYAAVILVTAKDGLDDVVHGLDCGADDYITKPFKQDELIARVRAAFRTRRTYRELQQSNSERRALRAEIEGEAAFAGIVGTSSAMRDVFELITKVAPSVAPVLITGESGTGKELVASAIHHHSQRRDKPFVIQNCSAFHENLLESELFGHVKGAFTGATRDKQGLFEVADGGTFFLDELGEMSAALQVKLLRVLQDGTFMPVGGTKSRKVDVRIVAATNRDVREMVKRGQFREDLFYRLNVVNIQLPALREREADIPLLIEHFLRRLALRQHGVPKALSEPARELLCSYTWPGNIRELENEIERLALMAGTETVISAELVAGHIRGSPARDAGPARNRSRVDTSGTSSLKEAIEIVERTMITEALARLRGNKSEAAKQLGISRSSLIAKVQSYGLEQGGADESD